MEIRTLAALCAIVYAAMVFLEIATGPGPQIADQAPAPVFGPTEQRYDW